MAVAPSRPIIRLKGQELVPHDEDRRVDLGVYDVLLPCRKYDISYKVAVLGQVSPTLEFLLRLAKAVPGIPEDDVAGFFGYGRSELAYVLGEAEGPEYIERRGGRIWLSTAGDALFRDGEQVPSIYAVEDRQRTIGFDYLSIAPQQPRSLDAMEFNLPDFPLDERTGAGSIAEKIPGRFQRFFVELAERRDREQFQRRDLYSIDRDRITPGDRFMVPVRIMAHAAASNPASAEIDLSSWRPENEIADRPQIESAAAVFIKGMSTNTRQVSAAEAYEQLVKFAPKFLDEFVTRAGLSVNRYWREAVTRAGEVRSDRKTIPLVGSYYLQENVGRLLSIVEYGMRSAERMPEAIISIPPQVQHWGASTLQRDTLAALRRTIQAGNPSEPSDLKTLCLFSGRPPRFLEKSFDEVRVSDSTWLPPALEMLLIPGIAVVATVHAPIGASAGFPVPLGIASFDTEVVGRAEEALAAVMDRYAPLSRQA
jgi:hypothetical protein